MYFKNGSKTLATSGFFMPNNTTKKKSTYESKYYGSKKYTKLTISTHQNRLSVGYLWKNKLFSLSSMHTISFMNTSTLSTRLLIASIGGSSS